MHYDSKHGQQGFTLIELMIVVAIIAIISVFAVPSYQNYTLRTHASDMLNATSAMKTAVSICLASNAATDCESNENGVPAMQSFSGFTVEADDMNGVINVLSKISGAKGAMPSNAIVALAATSSSSGITWQLSCTGDNNAKWCPN